MQWIVHFYNSYEPWTTVFDAVKWNNYTERQRKEYLTSVDPVNATLATPGWLAIAAPAVGP